MICSSPIATHKQNYTATIKRNLSINQKVEIHSTLRMMTSQSTSDNLNLPQYALVRPRISAPAIRIGSQHIGDVI